MEKLNRKIIKKDKKLKNVKCLEKKIKDQKKKFEIKKQNLEERGLVGDSSPENVSQTSDNGNDEFDMTNAIESKMYIFIYYCI